MKLTSPRESKLRLKTQRGLWGQSPALLCLQVFLLASCSNGNNSTPVRDVTPEVRALRESALALQLRPDNGLQEAEVQYVQIGVNLESPFRGRLGMAEAETLAADILKQARAGADFDKLVYQHSWEGPDLGRRPGAYVFVRIADKRAPSVRPDSMIPLNLRNAVWRLEAGEIGAVEYHRKDSDAYFIVRRLTEAERRADNPANVEPADEQVAAMRKAASEIVTRPELDASTVKVQHVLIGRYAAGNQNLKLKPLDAAQAEALAARVFADTATDNFDALVKEHTYDSHPGTYTMSIVAGVADAIHRDTMVDGFWKTAWRLQPGEIGVSLYDRYDSPFGYHIIKRLE